MRFGMGKIGEDRVVLTQNLPAGLIAVFTKCL